MGLVYGRMSFAQASRFSSGDQHTSCSPSKTKPDFRARKSSSARNGSLNLRRRSSGESDESNDQTPSVRLTRQASRQLALQRAANQRGQSVRRSARLGGVSVRATSDSHSNSISAAAAGAGASLPTTLRRSARIAGFRSIGHRVVTGGSRNGSHKVSSRRSPVSVIRRSARLARSYGELGPHHHQSR